MTTFDIQVGRDTSNYCLAGKLFTLYYFSRGFKQVLIGANVASYGGNRIKMNSGYLVNMLRPLSMR